jgi:hypothetical protein
MPIISNAHTATGPGANVLDAGSGNKFRSFSIKVTAPYLVTDSVVALETSPDGTTWTEAARVTGANWATGRSDLNVREARANVIGLGTGGAAIASCIVATP